MLLAIYYIITQKTVSPRKPGEDVMIKFCKSWEAVCEGTSLVKILQPFNFDIFGVNRKCLRKMLIKVELSPPKKFLLFASFESNVE